MNDIQATVEAEEPDLLADEALEKTAWMQAESPLTLRYAAPTYCV
jgi:hypothetical protein